MQEETKTFLNKIIIMASLLSAVVAVFLYGNLFYKFQSLPQNQPREIYVTGEGKAYAKPDIAQITFGVTSQAPKSEDAVSQNNQKMNAVIKAIKDLGVEDKDIKTTNYNLYPVYGSGKDEIQPLALYYPRDNNEIIAYRLEQQLEVKIRDFDKINQILDNATSKGANMAGNLQFTVDDIESVKAQARQEAILKAKEKAELLAKQTGLKLSKLVNISEGGGYYPVPFYQESGRGGVDVSAPQIEPGQTEVTISVTLTYRVR